MTASIEVADSDLNTDPYTQETIEITVSNGAKALIPFTLKEVSTNSILFSSSSNDQDLEFTLGTSIDYQAIQVVDEDTVTVTYNDISYSIDRVDEAIWYELGAPTRTPSPTCTITPTPTGTWFTPTPSPTVTDTPTPTGTWATSTPVPTITPTETPGGPTATPTVTPGPWTETDAWGYTGTTLATYNWIDASAGTALSITEDDEHDTVTLPFNFVFYGISYATVNVSSNGFLTFGNSADISENDYMPRETEPNAVIAPFFDNLDPSDTGTVYYLDSGTSATFEWDLVRHNRSWTDSYTFEVTLYDDGRIEFQYYVMSGIYADGYEATVGIENPDGTMALG